LRLLATADKGPEVEARLKLPAASLQASETDGAAKVSAALPLLLGLLFVEIAAGAVMDGAVVEVATVKGPACAVALQKEVA
jgi:hypothetical protein